MGDYSTGSDGGISWRFARGLVVLVVLCIGVSFGGALIESSSAGAARTTRHSGTVDVLYCGSLLDLMEQKIGPAFHQATGYSVSGFANGSKALANEIKGGTQVGDVFISASPSVNASLEGRRNGNWVSAYDEFGYSPLVLGYNPSSRFAKSLETRPWYDVVTRRGFLLGRTDPAIDPKGVLAVDALKGVALSYDVSGLGALASRSSNVFSETALVGDVQAGQLDAGFFYAVEAAAGHLATVPLLGTHLGGVFSVALLRHAPHEAAAKAFVKFLLGAKGRAILKSSGVVPMFRAIVDRAS